MRTLLWAGLMACAGLWLNAAAAGERVVVGWRTDTTGCYPDATPPLHWAPNQNVAWVTPMPGKSTATPVLVAGRIFVLADPDLLLCVNQPDGKVLWQRDNPVAKVAPQEDVAAADQGAGQRQELTAKLNEVKQARTALDARIAATPAAEDLKAQRAELDKQIADLNNQCARLPGSKPVKPHAAVGWSCCTPVSDGTVVVALYNSGVLVCYGLDGTLRWARFLRRVCKGYGQSMSPALSGHVVAVHLDDVMYGLDLQTGRTLWEDYELQHQGSPVALRVGELDLFLTCEGHLRRAEDGKVLSKLGGALNLFTTPALRGDTAYWVSENRRLTSYQFLPKGPAGVQTKAGGAGIPKGVYYASVLRCDGLLYLWNNTPPAPPDEPKKKMPKTLYVLDEKTGKVIKDLPLALGSWAYPSPTGAGGFVYVANDSGTCVVLAPGKARDFRTVATNTLEPFTSCPVFEQDCMYLRTQKNLFCIRASAADRKEAQEVLGSKENKPAAGGAPEDSKRD